MKEQIEEALQDFIEDVVTYQGKPTVDIIVRGTTDKPKVNNILIIDVNHNIDNIVVDLNDEAQCKGGGEMFWIFKVRDEDTGEDISEIAETKNDRIPELTFQAIIDNDSLGGRIPGILNNFKLISGLYELRNQEGVFFYVSHLTFGYEGGWIPPVEN